MCCGTTSRPESGIWRQSSAVDAKAAHGQKQRQRLTDVLCSGEPLRLARFGALSRIARPVGVKLAIAIVAFVVRAARHVADETLDVALQQLRADPRVAEVYMGGAAVGDA